MNTSLKSISDALAGAAAAVGPAVVAVHGRHRFPSSGVLWQPGIIVTAEHTLRNGNPMKVTLGDGSTVSATLAGRDPATDLAALRLEEESGASLRRAEQGSAVPGALAMVIGRSPNSGVNATLGIISAASGAWRTWRGGFMERYLRLDATLYPGSSGGAVIDTEGKAIGIATSALSRIAGLAIPAETVDRVLADLLAKGRVSRAYLGVGLQPIALPDHLKQQIPGNPAGGLIVISVEQGGPAEAAGLLVGDILVSLEQRRTEDTDDVQSALEGRRPGESLKAGLIRAGAPAELTFVLGERPGREE